MHWRIFFATVICVNGIHASGILYPRPSESRETLTLDGIWKFAIANRTEQNKGFKDKWYAAPLHHNVEVIDMPVPSSYNDITQDANIRDHIGWAWYQRDFFLPKSWKSQQVSIRFGSVNYYAVVWINGVEVTNHSGGYLPFEVKITEHLKFGHLNWITVAVNNTLTPWTIPQGKIVYHNDSQRYPAGYYEQQYNFDFFNFAGIHRPVILSATPKTYIDDITINTTSVTDSLGVIFYSVELGGSKIAAYSVIAEIYDAQHRLVAQAKGLKGEISINNPNLWWPRGMNESVGYLYTLKIQLWNDAKNVEGDIYRLPFGVRFIEWNSTGVYINGKSVYFKGFGRHEDAILRGRGLDLVTLTKDYNLMRWIEANSFRTSHYPYSEELMDLADQQGFLVIDEVPAVGLDNFDDELLEAHMQTLKELVQRDKNRPAVVMWSIGNEPQSQKQVSAHYFERVANYTRSLDLARPVTMVLAQSYASDLAAQFLDVICINRYFGWYSDTGHSELITYQMIKEVTAWHEKHLKPVVVTEYGAGALAGLHTDPPVVWTEDYQVVLMEQNFKAFDQLREMGYLIGEMIWNFADFATPQEYFRPTGCMKGVFTRERQPKFAAHFLRRRYAQLT
ncbi:beta-glucuronidase isoform X1 [Daphnia magna]|uniref:Beta-glucuronidase n=1 Tax=Daphnia magna TaxID=35525 RepID=A0A0P5IUZ2_9CRUS|nr:beta-glucuronidase isoform X1 [Daphnia magna]